MSSSPQPPLVFSSNPLWYLFCYSPDPLAQPFRPLRKRNGQRVFSIPHVKSLVHAWAFLINRINQSAQRSLGSTPDNVVGKMNLVVTKEWGGRGARCTAAKCIKYVGMPDLTASGHFLPFEFLGQLSQIRSRCVGVARGAALATVFPPWVANGFLRMWRFFCLCYESFCSVCRYFAQRSRGDLHRWLLAVFSLGR